MTRHDRRRSSYKWMDPPSYPAVPHHHVAYRPLPFIGSNISFRESPRRPLSNKEQIISLLFARYRTLALPDFLFWIRFIRPSIRALYPLFLPLVVAFSSSLYFLETIQTLSIAVLLLYSVLILDFYFIFSSFRFLPLYIYSYYFEELL